MPGAVGRGVSLHVLNPRAPVFPLFGNIQLFGAFLRFSLPLQSRFLAPALHLDW